ncbi:MAG: hypothetical protein KJ737_12965 [Proteobacteria bacterium]|nr:hypothetical protein [Pseudomonadota bacterium]
MIRYLILMIAFLMVIPCYGDPLSDGKAAGKTAGNEILQQLNSSSKINKRISVPMTDDAVPLQTLSTTNPQLIDISMTTESTDAFLEVTGNLLPTGDMAVTVKTDFAFTGTFTQTFKVPVAISGPCTNGFISSLMGSWALKKYLMWTVDDKMVLDITPVSSTDLAGCYCINNSCGKVKDTQSILETIGGAIVGAVQSTNPRLTVTKVDANPASIRFFGQDSSDTKNLHGTYYSGPDKPEKLYSKTSDTALKNATANALTTQQASPESYYNSLYTTFSSVQKRVSTSTCEIKRMINLTPSPSVVTTDTCKTVDLLTCRLVTESICDYDGSNCVNTYQSFNPTLNKPDTTCKNIGSYIFCNDGFEISDSSYGTILSGTGIWYDIKRQYQCQEESSYNFDTALDRASDVEDSTVLSGDKVSYTDLTKVTFNLNPDLSNGYDNCERVCKIRRIVEGTDVTKSGKVSDYRQDDMTKFNESYEYSYVPCDIHALPNPVCVIGPEFEGLIEGKDYFIDPNEICLCTDSFGSAMSALQSIKFASKDMICSKK